MPTIFARNLRRYQVDGCIHVLPNSAYYPSHLTPMCSCEILDVTVMYSGHIVNRDTVSCFQFVEFLAVGRYKALRCFLLSILTARWVLFLFIHNLVEVE